MSWTPLDYLTSAGRRADVTVGLTWFTLIVSILVCLIIAALLVPIFSRGRRASSAAEAAAVPVERGGDGLRWITIGVALSAVPIVVSLVWTMAALARAGSPPRNAGLTLDVTGRQWWWDIAYNGALPSDRFATANEIHIPVGVPVLVRLHGADVIHSFWVPKLAGKTDAVPGQQNLLWLEADAPGRFRGQCAEYCGLEHAKMAFEVVAEPPAAFARWRTAQLQPAAAPVAADAVRGAALFQFRCSLCHAVRGSDAGSGYGPDLTHLMSRRLIAAGALPNNPGALSGWVQAPQGIKPGALMPDQHLTGEQLADVRAYLETLK